MIDQNDYQAARVAEMIYGGKPEERVEMLGDPMVDIFAPDEWWISGGHWFDGVEVTFDSGLFPDGSALVVFQLPDRSFVLWWEKESSLIEPALRDPTKLDPDMVSRIDRAISKQQSNH